MHWHKVSDGEGWTKADVVANNRVKFEFFQRFGVLPGSSDTHVAEFFPGFVTAASDFGRDWGVHHYGLYGHQQDKAADDRSVAELLAGDEIPPWPSGELAAELLDGVSTGTERHLPVNLPNHGQVENLPAEVVVECIGVTGPDGVRPRDVARVDSVLGRAPPPGRRLPGAHGRSRADRQPHRGSSRPCSPTSSPADSPTSR